MGELRYQEGLMKLIAFCFFIIAFVGKAEDWTGFKTCGKYAVRGIVRKSVDRALVIVINEKTASEITFSVPIKEEPILAPYIDRPTVATVTIDNLSKGSKILGHVNNIDLRLPNPLNPADTGVSLISKGQCK